jgi:hypothetical protein
MHCYFLGATSGAPMFSGIFFLARRRDRPELVFLALACMFGDVAIGGARAGLVCARLFADRRKLSDDTVPFDSVPLPPLCGPCASLMSTGDDAGQKHDGMAGEGDDGGTKDLRSFRRFLGARPTAERESL